MKGERHGLSPRVRGNLQGVSNGVVQNGSIPASAGEPETPLPPVTCWTVYPRECGGTRQKPRYFRSVGGLSPRVRGNPRNIGFPAPCQRSIPASAGEPRPFGTPTSGITVYPRECGGTPIPIHFSGRTPGLSPRVRGNPSKQWVYTCDRRSIPASAGEPFRYSHKEMPRPVYPRECGGTGYLESIEGPRMGLSPRVRGNPLPIRHKGQQNRSIPASAGEPLWPALTQQRKRVYPRECGGTPVCSYPVAQIWGLSPRVRGNRVSSLAMASMSRSIPASAGEPVCL